MKYAVVKIKGHQYRISEKDEILVDKIKDKKPEIEVLLFVDGEKISVGKPLLKDIKVQVKVLGEEKGDKIDIVKYKAKSRYRRHIGFRPVFSKILIVKISSSK